MNVRNILSAYLLAMLLSACGLADSQHKKDIVGSWEQQDILETGVILQKTFIFSPDGKFLVATKRIEGKKTSSYQNEGTWAIEQGTLYFTTLSSTHLNIPTGYKYANKIIKITEKEIVSENPEGKVTIARRITRN